MELGRGPPVQHSGSQGRIDTTLVKFGGGDGPGDRYQVRADTKQPDGQLVGLR